MLGVGNVVARLLPLLDSEHRASLADRFASTTADMANTNPLISGARWALSRGPAYDEFTDPETGESVRYAGLGQQMVDYESERRDSYQIMAQSDAWDGGDANACDHDPGGDFAEEGAMT